MIQSIQSSNLSIQNNTILQNSKVIANSTSKIQEETQEGTTIFSQGDTLVISSEGMALSQKTFTGHSDDTTEVYSGSKTAATVADAAASIGIDKYSGTKNQNSTDAAAVNSSDADSSSKSTSNLSQYSALELKEMLKNGDITQAEYSKEIANRQAGDDTTEETNEKSSSKESDAVF